jgi:hypothetical protein
MKDALNTLQESAHRVFIKKLLSVDPRLISKHTARQYKADLFAFDTWRAGRTITKPLVEEYSRSCRLKARPLTPLTKG